MRDTKENIVDLRKAKEIKQIKSESNSFTKYLSVLSFSELNHEVNHLIDDINSTPITREVISKSSAIFKELYTRIEDESHELADAIREMKKDIELSLSKIF